MKITESMLLSTLLSSLSLVFGQSCDYELDPNAKCEPILNTVCKKVGYNNTSLPNLFNHSTQREAELFLSRMSAIIETNCSPYLTDFLCLATYPICFPNHFQQVQPCKELCIAARETCVPVLQQRFLEWPAELDCNLYQSYQSSLCIWTQTNCFHNKDHTEKENIVIENDVSFNCTGQLVKMDNSSRADFGGVEHCAEPCSGVYFDEDKQKTLLIWITAFSLITLVVCVVVLLTFILMFRKVPYLETPFYYISVCYGLSSLVYVISVSVGSESIICDNGFKNQFNETALISDATDHPLCLILFCVLYYCILCTWSWWVICTLQWFVSALKPTNMSMKWKICFHIIAWCTPLVFTLTALSLGHIAGDASTQTCWIQKQYELPFLVAPLFVAVLLCSVILVICFAFVVRLQKSKKLTNSDPDISKLSALTLVRVGLYNTVYLVPMGLLLCVYFYDFWYRKEWETQYLKCLESSSCQNSNSPVFEIFVMKTVVTLSMGVVSVLWILGQDFVSAWKKVFCFCSTNEPQQSGIYVSNRIGKYKTAFQLGHSMEYPTSSDSSI